MTPDYQRGGVQLNTIACTDALAYLATLPDARVHCCVTSPPYWGLRDYGLPPLRWPAVEYAPMAGLPPLSVPEMECCLGLERTPEAFVGHVVAVFREVRRVLRDDGVLWLNFGDSYATGAGKVGDCPGGGEQGEKWKGYKGRRGGHEGKHGYCNGANGIGPMTQPNRMPLPGLKPKDAVGIPWRVAFALQADGWWLRSDVIWHKPNPMPESVTDRPTKAHEYIFLLTKSDRYYYNAEAVKEVASSGNVRKPYCPGQVDGRGNGHDRNGGSVRAHADPCARNARSVWTIATQAFPGAHFATFPEELASRCIRAGTSERGCCQACGAPWVRVVEKTYLNPGNRSTNGTRSLERRHESAGFAVRLNAHSKTTGWRPSCGCEATEPVPCVVLDPFMGAGTVALVASALRRDYLGCEPNSDYAGMARNRVAAGQAFRNKPIRDDGAQLALEMAWTEEE